ncbi:RNA dependent RNA polymerase [Paenibacillus lutrae]|uniref:RDRP core domain-containing protein n=1 Tax=Paenibacillus lutrae TaxID=2078573 RepID=A0A7X3FJB2_9BACL|nr:hypothetical protein [Paenibacillus lutrae]MVP00809.1 hypothetical protein [Paenibacillus lutrae]
MNTMYEIIKLSIQEIIRSDFKVELSSEDEQAYVVKQQDTPLFRQICLVRGNDTERIGELIYVEAKHNKNRIAQLQQILREGFYYNAKKYVRFGKSSSQSKDGVTVFIHENLYPHIMMRSQLGLKVESCIIPKYESYRCLILSSCQFVETPKLPYIVMVDEFQKILPQQYVRYASKKNIEYVDKDTQEIKTALNQKFIEEGLQDIHISPFDGFGVHTKEMSQQFSKSLNLPYTPIGYQIRLPFLKGMTVEAPIKQFYADSGITEIKDIFGVWHQVSDIDCIWNVSMWKAYGLFKSEFGTSAWTEYLQRVEAYNYKIGISKVSHHTRSMNKYSKMNFQYLQCLDLMNVNYVQQFKDKKADYDILDEKNHGKIIQLAKYTTDLFEKIIKGDKFYTLKFLGIYDTEEQSLSSKYVEAILLHDDMLKDPPFRNMLKRKLNKAITQLKYGKIYTEGFYHIIVGDIIGYLEYSGGLEVKGCLEAGEFYTQTLPVGDCLSFRSPLVDPSEVNKIKIADNFLTNKYLKYFDNQDMCMINMYDLTMPQQGGADEDGDSFFLSPDKTLIESKINKPIVVDIEDKLSVTPVEYDLENIIQYECNSRDNRIGEITNIATAILNQYTENEEIQKINDDNVSLLRLYQGKEIDFIKTGYRWVISKNLRNYLKKIPYFLLYNYPKKLDVYLKIREANKHTAAEDKIPSNAFKSPSALNELCDYVCQWENTRLKWDRSAVNNGHLLINPEMDCSDRGIIKQIKRILLAFRSDLQTTIQEEKDFDVLLTKYRDEVNKLPLTEEYLANYFILVSYRSIQEDKVLCWSLFGDTILANLRKNGGNKKQSKITQVEEKTADSFEFLGNYYSFTEI